MIETRDLTKIYGDRRALAGVDLKVPDGSVYGLVGPNGAGKTTLLGILAGLRRSSSGTVKLAVGPKEMAILPDTPRFDPWLTGAEVVSLAQHLTDPDGDSGRVEDVLAGAGLADAKDRRVGGYSRGMLQRLGVACTIVGRPRLVLLDEPASALDPQGRREVLDLISRLRGSATILFSSHILGDVQEVCDTVGVLDDGALLFQGPIESLLVGQAVPRIVVRLRAETDRVEAALSGLDWVTGVERLGAETLAVAVTSLDVAETSLPGALASTGAAVISFHPEEVTLERAFLELTR
jgi:ABC-2 type transport system ATP-binding protein